MKIKGIDRTANVAWSPQHQYPIYLAAGTAAQQLDASFSTSAALEIYSLNLNDPGVDMGLKCTVQSEQRFHKLTWGSFSQNSGAIVGGCDNGVIQLYNATKLLNGENGLISQQSKHKGPVKALDFNSFQSNLLASGASESEIFIWDLNNTATPMTPGSKSQPAEDITSIAWNKQVQHILASSFPTKCVVWDLRKNDPIIKLSDSASRIRWNVVAWNPEIATQLCLGSEEDQNPVIQLWDLRFATSPLKILENHQRGVLSVSWCHQDTDMLLSCGKDNRILCWNPNSTSPEGEVICEIMSSNQWNFDVSWCPRNPALFVCSSFDGHVSIYSVVGGPQQVQTSNKIADSFPGMELYTKAPVPQTHAVPVELRKPPKWLRKPVGATFGFGGKLVTFGHHPNPATNERQERSIYISQVVTEPQLISRSSQLESALQNGDYAEFCRAKIAQSNSSHEKSIWQFLSAYFEPSPRTEFLSLLGFQNDDLQGKLGKFVGKPANARTNDVLQLSDRMATLGRSTDSDSELDGCDEVTDHQRSYMGPDGLESNTDLSGSAAFDEIAASQTQVGFKISTGDDIDGLICQALLLGNTEAAVELCLQDNRMADAIILAMTGGSELLAKTQYRYFQQSSGYLSTLISAVVTEDWTQVIQNCDIDSWKEALAAAITHTNEREFPLLCELLGERLETEKRGALANNAQLCYICAGNLSKLVSSWMKADKMSSPNNLQDLVELVMILKKAVELQGNDIEISGRLAECLSNYASLLASQGSMEAALSYLGASNEERVAELRDRLNWSLGRNEMIRRQQQQQQQQQQLQRRLSSQSLTQRTRTLSSGMYPPQHIQEEPLPPPPAAQPNFNLNPFQSNQMPANNYQPAPFVPAPPQPAPAPPTQVPPQARVYPSQSPGLSTGGVTSRTKHVLDPSVQSSHPLGNQTFYPQNQFQPPTSVPYSQPLQQNQPFNLNPTGGYPTGNVSGGYPTSNISGGYPAEVFNPPVNPTPPPPPPPSITKPPMLNQPPGWNDPPAISGNKNLPRGDYNEMSAEHAGTRKWNSVISHKQPKQEYVQQAPITHPLFGAAPEVPMNGQMYDPYHQQHPPQPSPLNQPPQQPPQQSFLPPQSFPNQQFQQYQPPQNNYQNSAPTPPAKQAPPEPVVKKPIPDEHIVLQTVFEELRNRCTAAANNPQSKRKLEEVSKKLEALYDNLRDSKLSNNTLEGLHLIAQHVQAGDYPNGLHLHTQLVSGPDFSQIASFMPGIKVLLQSALQLQVYL